MRKIVGKIVPVYKEFFILLSKKLFLIYSTQQNSENDYESKVMWKGSAHRLQFHFEYEKLSA